MCKMDPREELEFLETGHNKSIVNYFPTELLLASLQFPPCAAHSRREIVLQLLLLLSHPNSILARCPSYVDGPTVVPIFSPISTFRLKIAPRLVN